MRPFECNRCHARSYSEKTPKVCDTCKFDKFTELVSICLLLPVEVEPAFPVVHESGEVPSDDGGVNSVLGQKWVLACKSSALPAIATPEPDACTCYHCKRWYDKRLAELAAQSPSSPPETMGVGNPDKPIEMQFEGFDGDEYDVLDEFWPSEEESLDVVESTEPDKLP